MRRTTQSRFLRLRCYFGLRINALDKVRRWQSVKVVLLRVGIDSGCGGMQGPIFENNSFDVVPINSSHHRLGRMYGNVAGRHKRKLIEYFPKRLQNRMRDCFVHDDPEFESYTYGDPTGPKQSLRRLESGDLLVFYAGLCGWGDCRESAALYIIGYFEVSYAGLYPDLAKKYSKDWVEKTFGKNFHIIHGDLQRKTAKRKLDLVLVKGGKGSKLLNKAVRLSGPKKALDRGGHRIFVLDPALKKYFGSFTKLNAIQRSIPRCVKDEYVQLAARFVRGLE
jgi:hypothetical protein